MEIDNLRCGRRESLNDCSDVCVRERQRKAAFVLCFCPQKLYFTQSVMITGERENVS